MDGGLGGAGRATCHLFRYATHPPPPAMSYYINRQEGRYHETVSEYDNKTEALKDLPEYQFGEHGRAYYYVSQVPRHNWKD